MGGYQTKEVNHADEHAKRKLNKKTGNDYTKVRPYLNGLDKDVKDYTTNIEKYIKNISDDSKKQEFDKEYKELRDISEELAKESRAGLGIPFYSPFVAGSREISQSAYASSADKLRNSILGRACLTR